MKNLHKIILVAFIAVVSWNEIVANDNHNALFGIDTSKVNKEKEAKVAVISAKGKLGDGKSMCGKFSKSEIFGNSDYEGEILNNLGKFLFDGKYSVAQMERKMDMQMHYAEIKESEKESICVYIRTFDTAFLNIKLTAQDIEQFERFLAQRGEYKDKDKKYILDTLKFFKYYNVIDKFYAQYDKVTQYDYVNKNLYKFVELSSYINGYNFVYGTKQNYINGFTHLNGIFEGIEPCTEYFGFNGQEKECKAYYKPIYQWQKSIIEQSKKPKQKVVK